LFTALSAQYLFADINGNCSSCEQDPCCQTDCCEPCDFVPPCPPSACAYNAPFIIDTKCDWGFFVGASFVYAQGLVDQPVFYYEGLRIGISPNSTNQNNFFLLDFDYKPGFKVNLGYKLGCDNWTANCEYFRFHNDIGKGSYTRDNYDGFDSVIIRLFGSDAMAVDGSEITNVNVNATYSIEIDQLDFTLSRKYYVGRCLTIKSEAGLRAFWLDQSLNGAINAIQAGGTLETNGINESTSLWSVGPLTKLDLDWMVSGNLRILTNSSLAILYYEQSLNSYGFKENLALGNLDDQTRDYKSRFKELSMHNSLFLGLGWADYFFCNDWYFDFVIGYEFNRYTEVKNQGEINNYNNGSIYVQGLVIDLSVSF